MRHGKRVKKLGRTKAHREAMLANLASSLIINEYIVTTLPKAKSCKSFFDNVVSQVLRNNTHSKRRVLSILKDKLAVEKLINVLLDQFGNREGGYTTLIKLPRRKGDNSPMAKLVLIGSEPIRKAKKKARTRKEKKEVVREKKQKQQEKKKGFFDRVREIRGRLKSSNRERGQSRVDKDAKRIDTKSRSGI